MATQKIEPKELPPEPTFDGPLIERAPQGEVSITKDGLAFVEWLASNGATHDMCAARLDIDVKTFDRLLGPANSHTPTRAAFNLGKQNMKFEIRRWQIEVMRGGDKIMPMFLGKALLGDRDSGPGVNVEINNTTQTGAGMGRLVVMPYGLSAETEALVKAELAAQGKFTLPGPMSTEAYMQKIGQEKISDGRSDAAKKLHAEMFALPAPTEDELPHEQPDEGGGIV